MFHKELTTSIDNQYKWYKKIRKYQISKEKKKSSTTSNVNQHHVNQPIKCDQIQHAIAANRTPSYRPRGHTPSKRARMCCVPDLSCFRAKARGMETCAPPGLYLDPPTFDIELHEFEALPSRRLEAIRFLRKGEETGDVSESRTSEQQARTSGERLSATRGQVAFPLQLCILVSRWLPLVHAGFSQLVSADKSGRLLFGRIDYRPA